VKKLRNSKQNENILTTNIINHFTAIEYDNLSRFFYYKWLHHTENVPLNFFLSDIVFSNKITELSNEIKNLLNTSQISSYHIVDNKVFSNTIQNIIYYYDRKLITKDELLLIQNDLLVYLNSMEKMARNGCTKNGHTLSIYLSSTNIETNFWYIAYDDQREMMISMNTMNGLIIGDNNKIDTYMKWIYAIKKNSILITDSNEMQRANFFNAQYEYIDKMIRKD